MGQVLMDSFVFNFDDALTQQSFVDRCVRHYGIDPESLYVSKSAGFVVIDKADSGLVQKLRTEHGVVSAAEDAYFGAFPLRIRSSRLTVTLPPQLRFESPQVALLWVWWLKARMFSSVMCSNSAGCRAVPESRN